MSSTPTSLTVAEAVRAEQAASEALERARQAIVSADERSSDAHLDTLEASFKNAEREQSKARAKVAIGESDEFRAKQAAGSGTQTRVTGEPLTYGRGGEHSFYADMFRSKTGDTDATARLERHRIETRALNETSGTGGTFVPPKYLQDQWIKLARPARPIADAVGHMDLPPGANQVIIPKVASGVGVASQVDNTTVQSTDLTD